VLELETHIFEGASPDFVLIIAGIHTSEQTGVEVARWIRVKLAAQAKRTGLSVALIPEIFPDEGRDARTAELKNPADLQDFRERVRGQEVFPARQFPPPGKPLSDIKKGVLIGLDGKALHRDKDKKDVIMLPEIEYVIRCIETLKPVRIVSIHGKSPRSKKKLKVLATAGLLKNMTPEQVDKWDGQTALVGANFAGIFVDPRYVLTKTCQSDLESCKFDLKTDPAFPPWDPGTTKRFDSALTVEGQKDDALALKAASDKGFTDATLIAGNHVTDPQPIVHYAKEPGTPTGFSLGDWGPVDVDPTGKSPGSRHGAPVFTIEVKEDPESWAFADEIQIMKTDGSGALKPRPTPDERARRANPPPYAVPKKWKKDRTSDLQQYADAIINTLLEP
jgi:hypothetical protein